MKTTSPQARHSQHTLENGQWVPARRKVHAAGHQFSCRYHFLPTVQVRGAQVITNGTRRTVFNPQVGV